MTTKIQKAIIEFICLLYVLLFVYAAVSKLLDFENFQVQLGQSPLLSAFAGWVSVLVPAIELLICVLIVIPKFRAIGLFASYGLMVMFTAYIFIVLHYTSFVPCSCGGVLEKLNWTQHLIFNTVFVILAILALILFFSNKELVPKEQSKTIFVLFICISFFSIASVVGLFLMSENIIHYHNKLARRFPHTSATLIANMDLKLNSYYIAGVDNDRIYLGNTTAPLLITTLDTILGQWGKKNIDLDRKDLPFQAIKVIVRTPNFYVLDGLIPCVYKGSTKDWKAKLIKKGGEYFTTAQAIDSTAIAVRTFSSINGEAIMGIINPIGTTKTILNQDILQKQFDGVFDTDGQLLYSTSLQRFIFLYAYRNQFTVFDKHLKIDFRGNTIDTISHAKLSVVKVVKHHQRKFSKPPLFVNKSSAAYSNLLFVNSAIPGKYEQDVLWKKASIIDVYNVVDNSYLLSFYIYDIDGRKMRSFVVNNNKLYALIGKNIVCYNLEKRITANYKK
ncbi:MauE/DoxX family redox-associated membrane protein [Flavobacterium adhaerens]|uniref:MauE/DoxX family redox-associated membrane protein n=1 Tax=Flavobacterium adhaerens TaxID=3149043 RepID=UPI0032B4D970